MQHCCFRGCCTKILLQLPSLWFSFPSSSVPRVSPWVLVWINLNSCHYFHIRQLSWVETGDKRKIFRGRVFLSCTQKFLFNTRRSWALFCSLLNKLNYLGFPSDMQKYLIFPEDAQSASTWPSHSQSISPNLSLTMLIKFTLCHLCALHKHPMWEEVLFFITLICHS